MPLVLGLKEQRTLKKEVVWARNITNGLVLEPHQDFFLPVEDFPLLFNVFKRLALGVLEVPGVVATIITRGLDEDLIARTAMVGGVENDTHSSAICEYIVDLVTVLEQLSHGLSKAVPQPFIKIGCRTRISTPILRRTQETGVSFSSPIVSST